MISFPNAKINLGLNVIEKRSDGFHNIETVFYPVQWCDMLEISSKFKVQGSRLKEKISFSESGLKTDSDLKNNLCVRAYQLVNKDFRLPPVKIHLHKIIPSGAGLGGGSSDAAFTLKILNQLFDLKLSKSKLSKYASQIGSDCAFFIDNAPVFAFDRGEKMETINLSLKGYFILIVKPPVHISTTEAYQNIIPQKPDQSIKEIIKQPVANWKNILKNDFEKNAIEKFPVIGSIKNKMYKQGAIYSSMSGSGSAVYGIFKEKNFDEKIFKDCLVWAGLLE